MSVWDTIDSLLAKQKTHDSMEWEVMSEDEVASKIGKRRARKFRSQQVSRRVVTSGSAYEAYLKEHA